jgi:hypothetical protein
VELIPMILDQLHSEVIVKTAFSAAKSERWLEIPFHKLFVPTATVRPRTRCDESFRSCSNTLRNGTSFDFCPSNGWM